MSTGERGWLRKVILLGIGLCGLWLLLEAGLWLFRKAPRHSVYRYSLENSFPGLPAKSEFEVDTQELRSVAGARGRAQEVRLLVMGEHFTYQPLQSAPQTWWGLMSQKLESQVADTAFPVSVKTSTTVPTANEPIPAIRDGLRWARRYLTSVDPDVVIVGYGLAELLDLGNSYRFDPLAQDVSGGPRNPLKEWVMDVSQVARTIRQSRALRSPDYLRRQEMLGQKDVFVKQWSHRRTNYVAIPADTQPFREGNADPLMEYLEGLKRIVKEARKTKAKIILVGEPALYDSLSVGIDERLVYPRWEKFPGPDGKGGSPVRATPVWLFQELNRFHAAAQAWCEKEKILFLSLHRDEIVPKSLEHFVDDTTLTDQGSEALADHMARLVRSTLSAAKQ